MISLLYIAHGKHGLRTAICAGLCLAASFAGAQVQPTGGFTIRSPQPLGAEEAVSWQVMSVRSSASQLALQLAGNSELLTISPWPANRSATKYRQGAQALGLVQQRLPREGVKLTAVQVLQPFGPAQRLSVQYGSRQPSLVVQTRAQSGQTVTAGWRAVYAGQRWVLQSDVAAKPALDASRTQRIYSAGRAWCVYPSARPAGPEGQESPPLLDWALMAAPAKSGC